MVFVAHAGQGGGLCAGHASTKFAFDRALPLQVMKTQQWHATTIHIVFSKRRII
jgi:hypothetical protein